jgi:hypothetical protein
LLQEKWKELVGGLTMPIPKRMTSAPGLSIGLSSWRPGMINHDKQHCRADGGDIGTGRLRDIADNPYGD